MATDLTKLDVARRQLAVAIRLFFDDWDPVSVHTLASNAWEIVDALCRKRGIDSISEQTRRNVPYGKDLKRDFINKPYRNFFKHADSDPDDTVEGFSDSMNDDILFLVVDDLIQLEQPALYECQVFQIWYLAVYEERTDEKERERFMPDIREALPGISQLPRSKQKKMGRNLLHHHCNDKRFLADPRVMSEWNRWEAQS